MPSSNRGLRALSLLATVSLAGAGLAVTGGSAATASTPQAAEAPAAGGAPTSVSVLLRAPHPQALARLATSSGLSRPARLARLAGLVPGDAQHRQVVDALRAQGLTVTHESAWSVTAEAPATLVTDLFGSRPAAQARGGEVSASGVGALPDLPASLTGLVSGVWPTTGGPAAFHHSTSSLTGTDVRRADTPARVAPSTGKHDSKLTVATVQLAPFSSGDLSAYARSHHLADPVASGRFREVRVDGGATSGGLLDGGAVEVDLDQESILSTAPSARQHAYFAPNTEAGFADAFSAIYDDVTGNKHATAPDKHIVAASVSWGECEALTGAHSIGTFEPILESLVAAGVTIFSSAGDAGIYDCGSGRQADVDFPASSPAAISVGGTRLHAASSKPNTGTNWSETVWSCSTPTGCQNGTGGGGGGASGTAYHHGGTFKGFKQPLYQRVALHGSPYGSSAKRLVPDIAADGDPQSGFEVYTSDLATMLQFGGHTGVVGGTSLAAPLSAAQLANTLGDAHRSTGVGDIHGALYSAYVDTRHQSRTSRTRAFRDVTSGRIGAQADRGRYNPSTSAAPGYDTASGLGGVLWKALRPYLLSSATPSLTATLRATGHGGLTATWHATQGRDPILLATTRAVVLGAGKHDVLASYGGAHGSPRFNARPGSTVTLVVATEDIAGRVTKRTLHVRVR